MPTVMLAAAAITSPIGLSIATPVNTNGSTGTGVMTVTLPMNLGE
jgi:hypothetical protein